MRLSPRDPLISMWQVQLGDVEIASGNIDASMLEYKKAFDAGYRPYFVYANLAAVYALAGKIEEAKSYAAEALRLNPNFTIKWYREHAEDIPAREPGLRKAGFADE